MRWSSDLLSRRQFVGGAGLLGVGLGLSAFSATPVKATVAADWAAFKSRFVAADGRIVDTGNGGISHSEGQAYGMLLSQAANDREAFERIWNWTYANIARKDMMLFAWRFDPLKGVTDNNNATDGDILAAWALQLASERWKVPAYAEASRKIRDELLNRLVRRFGGRTVLLPGMTGFQFADSVTVNPSYFVFPALDMFAKLEPRSQWGEVRDECLRIVREGKFGAVDIPVDWMRVDQAGRLWSDPDRPAAFGYDAIRVPLYLVWSGRANDQALRGVRLWWSSARVPGKGIPATVNVVTGAPSSEPLSPGANRVVELVLNGRLTPAMPPMTQDYYSMVLWLLASLAAER